jgi:hypothetical protein
MMKRQKIWVGLATAIFLLSGISHYSVDSSEAGPVMEATVDIRPDTLNLESKGRWITAYIEPPEDNHPEGIEISTVRISDIDGNPVDIPAQERPTEIGDYDDDGIPDLMVKFDRSEVRHAIADPGMHMIGVTWFMPDYGMFFEAWDIILALNVASKLPCKITVTLNRVTYRGHNIGNDWSYLITVGTGVISVPKHKFNWKDGSEARSDSTTFIQGWKGDRIYLTLIVIATEHDPIWNDVGSNNRKINAVCPSDVSTSVQVLVKESPGGGVARLTFYFTIHLDP